MASSVMVKTGIELGYRNERGRFILAPCQECGKERWVQLVKGKPVHTICFGCANKYRARFGADHPRWNNGKRIHKAGYMRIKIYPDNPFYGLAGLDGYVLEHRLVIAQFLGRLLTEEEQVHHINGNKTDNRIENLYLIPRKKHKALEFGLSFQQGYELGYKQGYEDALKQKANGGVS